MVNYTYTLFLRQAYLWEDNKAVVQWLDSQLKSETWEGSVLYENIKCVQRDHVIQQIRK